MLQKIPSGYSLESNVEWDYNQHKYILYVENMTDFKGNTKAKLLFFNDISSSSKHQEQFITTLFYMFGLFLILMFFVLNSSFNKLLNNLKELHRSHTEEIKEKDNFMISQSRQAAMGEMISMIAHQWRQPLTVINMHAINMTLEDELGTITKEQIKKHLEGITLQIESLSKTITNIMKFFKPDKAKENIFIQAVIINAMKILEDTMKNDAIELISDFHSNSKIFTYPNELLQILLILLNNAKDALSENRKEGSKIIVSCYEKDNFAYIEVCDNGMGIDEKHFDDLFTPYFSTKGKNGTGLGLYILKVITNKHLNGTVSFKNIENGACFTIELPLNDEKIQIEN